MWTCSSTFLLRKWTVKSSRVRVVWWMTWKADHDSQPGGAQTRARIVAAAADLMLLGGVAETSLDAVLAATGTSKSQVYHYFANKDDLVLAVIAWQTERVLQSQQP
jgi:AcrR family transcriptional regulator